MIGMFFSMGSAVKWLSASCPPSRSASKFFIPMKIAIDKPIDDQREYLPPTQSHKTNIFSGWIPNSITASELLEIATKWFFINSFFFALSINQSRAEKALVIVSCVVKVLDAIINNVVSGSQTSRT